MTDLAIRASTLCRCAVIQLGQVQWSESSCHQMVFNQRINLFRNNFELVARNLQIKISNHLCVKPLWCGLLPSPYIQLLFRHKYTHIQYQIQRTTDMDPNPFWPHQNCMTQSENSLNRIANNYSFHLFTDFKRALCPLILQ